MYRRTSPNRRQRRRGNIALITAVMVVVLIGFVALSFDVGNLFRVRTETQTALDSAALGGASAIGSNLATIQNRAMSYANRHNANQSPLTLAAGNVSLGVWDRENGGFFATVPAGGTGTYISAVRVSFDRDVATPFASVSGTQQLNVGARAIAMRGGPTRAACAFPLVVSANALANAAQTNCNVCLQLYSNDDNAGWTAFAGAVNPNTVRTALANACFTSPQATTPALDANGACAGTCTSGVSTGQTIPVNNGNNLNTGNNNFCPLIRDLLMRTGTATPFTVDVSVIPGAAFSGDQTVVGISRLSVYGVRCGPGNGNVVRVANMPSPSCPNDSPNVYVLVALPRDVNGNCDTTSRNVPGTGVYYGTYGRPVLVE